MFELQCPFCGDRAEDEFLCGGTADEKNLKDELDCSDQQWGASYYFKTSTVGPRVEKWQHVHGCRLWFKVIRDTRDHSILRCYALDENIDDKSEYPNDGEGLEDARR